MSAESRSGKRTLSLFGSDPEVLHSAARRVFVIKVRDG
jgi:hypothetical protein